MNWVDRLRTSADKRMWSGRRAVVMRTGRGVKLGVKLGCPRSRCRAVVSDVLCVRSYVHFVCMCVYMCMCADMIYVYTYACVYVFVHLCVYTHVYVYVYAYLCIGCGSWYQYFSVWTVSCMRSCFRVHMHAYTYVCRCICMCIFFAVSVTYTLQVLWALVHGRVCMLHRCFITLTYTSATHSLQVVHICVYVYMCVYVCTYIWMRMCVYDIA